MSRHRSVRSMNYSEEYEGYDDVYGHSVEDDYCVSPSAEQFLFDRSKQQNMASFITEPDIVEDNEDGEESVIPSNEKDVVLTELERAKLVSCMDSIKNIIGDTVPDSEIQKKILQSNFNADVALDLVLKESPPKNVVEPLASNKDDLEHYPDATSAKPQTSSFIVLKLSFKKEDSIENATANASFKHNLETLKNLTISNHPTTFSSLSEITTNHAKSLTNSIREPQTGSNTVPFNSLADLTAHHLQKSSSLINDTNSTQKPFSPNTNFLIPKLSIRQNGSSDLNDRQLGLSTVLTNRNVELNSIDVTKKDYSMDLLEKSISNVLALSEDCTNIKPSSQNLKTEEDSLTNVHGIRTPSPDNWMIDLSSALKEATSLVSDNCSQKELKVLTSSDNNIPNTSLNISNQNFEIPYVVLPTTLNLSCLKSVRLPYTKQNVSLFGRTLCRSWKWKKPILKSQEQQYETVKRFDFSVPYHRV